MRKRDNTRTIATTQRYGEDLPETVLDLDKETGLVVEQGDVNRFVIDLIKAEILSLMASGEKCQERQIKQSLSNRPNGMISKTLRELVDEGTLNRTGQGARGKPYE